MKKGEKAWNKGIPFAKYPFGMYQSPTYVSWNNMKSRCRGVGNKKNKLNYLDRGISFDPRWENFNEFLKDMGVRPDRLTLERIDNCKGYSKGNCKWASYSEQNRNRRSKSNTEVKHITKWDRLFIVSVKPFSHIRCKDFEKAKEIRTELLNLLKNNVKLKGNTMIAEQITYTKRHNEGDYSYSEYTVIANLEEGDDVLKCYNSLKQTIADVISNKVSVKEEVKPEVRNTPAEPKEENVEVIAAIPVKAKRNATKKEKSEEIAVIPVSDEKSNIPDVIVEKVKPSKVTKYSSVIPEHKSIFGGYLAKKYQDTWKTKAPVEEIKAFTASLNGQDFIDDKGTIVPTFLELIHTFFGM